MEFYDYMRQLATSAISAIPTKDASEIYAISFFVEDEDDDPRRPTMTVGYNTETRVRESVAGRAQGNWDEARWNFAHWLQNQLAFIGDRSDDPVGARLRETWLRSAGFWFEYPDRDEPWDDELDDLEERITMAFVDSCVALAREIHTTGLIERVLGRPVPILVHELEYYEAIANQAERSNPPGLADAFAAWVREPW